MVSQRGLHEPFDGSESLEQALAVVVDERAMADLASRAGRSCRSREGERRESRARASTGGSSPSRFSIAACPRARVEPSGQPTTARR